MSTSNEVYTDSCIFGWLYQIPSSDTTSCYDKTSWRLRIAQEGSIRIHVNDFHCVVPEVNETTVKGRLSEAIVKDCDRLTFVVSFYED